MDYSVTKLDEDRNLVFGWANVAMRADGSTVTDSQQDRISPTDLEDAAYLFNLEFRDANEMHEDATVGRLVESFVVTPEKLKKMGLEPNALPLGWWVGFHVDDRTFAKVKRGELSMFSIEGVAVREAA